jgi:hypothetical protein
MVVSTLLQAQRNNRSLNIRPLVAGSFLDSEKDGERTDKELSLRRCVISWRLEVLLSRDRKNRARQAILFFLGTEGDVIGDKDEELIWSYVEIIRQKLNAVLVHSHFFSASSGCVKNWHHTRKRYVDLMPVWREHFTSCKSFKQFIVLLPMAVRQSVALLEEDYILEIEGIDNDQVRILNLDFIPGTHPIFDTKHDPLMELACDYCYHGNSKGFFDRNKTQEVRTEEEKYRARKKELQKKVFSKITNYERHCRTMTGGHMRIFAFRELTDNLILMSNTESNVDIRRFWHCIRCCIPGAPLVSGDTRIESTASMLYTVTESAQEPHQDYCPRELDVRAARESCVPWGMDYPLGEGGLQLNIWHGYDVDDAVLDDDRKKPRLENLPEGNYAVRLNIPYKYVFLMRGDTVHGGALQNRTRNGAIRVHCYLSPGNQTLQSRSRTSIAHTKRYDSNIFTKTKENSTARAFACYLVQHNGTVF